MASSDENFEVGGCGCIAMLILIVFVAVVCILHHNREKPTKKVQKVVTVDYVAKRQTHQALKA